jgi:Domain of unknown function (DUF1929)/Bacterial Ig domain
VRLTPLSVHPRLAVDRRRTATSIVLAVAALALVPAGAGAGHPAASTGRDHVEEDAVSHDPAMETRFNQLTKALSAVESQAATVAGTEGEVGQWGPVADWPLVPMHAALLPNGKVLAYDNVGDMAPENYPDQTSTRATVWDPATGSHTDVRYGGYNLFCSGLAHLTDGSLFLAGGNKNVFSAGLEKTNYFDPAANTWTLGPDMAVGRWYPSLTPLPNGEMLITEGGPDIPEVRQTDGTLRTLSSASQNLDRDERLYPWIDVAPNGRAFVSGPDTTMRSLDTAGTGAWTDLGARDDIYRDYGSHALYDIGKILVAGGGPAVSDSRVIDLRGATPQVSATSPMAFGRRYLDLTVLADGSVLATGGNSNGAFQVDLNAGVFPAELWDPATGNWKTLAPMSVTRQYHSTALLLPDGRVLSAGGGVCFTCDQVGYLGKNSQVFTPPYLFKKDGSGELAPRPEITSAPSKVPYGAALQIATPNASSIAKAALVRIGAVTHNTNMEQRYVPLSFTASGGSVTATVPTNPNVAPPGVYMLFIVDGAGVPSVARMIQVDPAAPPPPPPPNQRPSVALTAPANGATYTQPARVDLAATASDPDGSVAKVGFYAGSKLIGEDTTAPYTWRWNVSVVGNHVLTARATDNAGATTTSSPVTITVRKKR